MKKLVDNQNSLVWHTPEIISVERWGSAISYLEKRQISQLFDQMNGWQSDNIRQFIIGDSDLKLGELCQWFVDHPENYRMFFGFDSGKLAVFTVIENATIVDTFGLFDYASYCQMHDVSQVEGYMPINRINDIFTAAQSKTGAYIQYLIVAPEMQGRGIGTSAVKSIIGNINDAVSLYSTDIHKENIASQKVFSKNGFARAFIENDDHEGETYYNLV